MQAACEAVLQSPSEDNVVRLLELWSPEWKHRGRQRAIGSGSYEQYCTLGIFAYGGNDPCLSKASANKEACVALNHFLRSRFPRWDLDFPRRGAQPSHWPASRHPKHDRQAEPRDRSRILHGRKDLGGRRRWHVSGSESYEAQHSAAVGLLDRHARRAGLLRCSPLSQGGAPRGPYVGYRRLHTPSVRALLFGKS